MIFLYHLIDFKIPFTTFKIKTEKDAGAAAEGDMVNES